MGWLCSLITEVRGICLNVLGSRSKLKSGQRPQASSRSFVASPCLGTRLVHWIMSHSSREIAVSSSGYVTSMVHTQTEKDLSSRSTHPQSLHPGYSTSMIIRTHGDCTNLGGGLSRSTGCFFLSGVQNREGTGGALMRGSLPGC